MLALAICSLLSRTILLYFPIWLLGACLARVQIRRDVPLCGTLSLVGRYASGRAFVGILVGSHTSAAQPIIDVVLARLPEFGSVFGNDALVRDYATGITFCLWMFFRVNRQSVAPPDRTYHQVASLISSFSYTLYLTDLSIVVFAHSFTAEKPWMVDPWSLLYALALTAMCLGLAYVMSRVTEGKTREIRALISFERPTSGKIPT